ncbi:MAG TPA: intradiol ring-cleavage dioxygenase, partial [Sphingobacteriaceae bacterium]
HIHAAIKEPESNKSYYITDFVFKDDKFVTPTYASSVRGVGGSGILDLRRTDNGWTGKRDIILKR